uniref:Uncharacterized protein n=1 Tax=Ananas comosus var. bracteatus TaxID=296719 RepID=A0A6V7Q455_ANACO|nr:unnamed protein product [Ananas comosus var. bracteatus]
MLLEARSAPCFQVVFDVGTFESTIGSIRLDLEYFKYSRSTLTEPIVDSKKKKKKKKKRRRRRSNGGEESASCGRSGAAAVGVLLRGCCRWEKRFASRFRPLVTKESRTRVVATESGTITAVDVRDGCAGAYHLQFITLEPSSLFLPVLLHSDMVFYVHTGLGRVSYLQEDYKHGTQSIDVERGDVYRLEQGSVFYVESNLLRQERS